MTNRDEGAHARVSLKVNGEQRQHGDFGDLKWGPAKSVEGIGTCRTGVAESINGTQSGWYGAEELGDEGTVGKKVV